MSRTEKAYFSKFAFKYDKKYSVLSVLYQAIERLLKKGIEVNEGFEAEVRKLLGKKIPVGKIPVTKRRLMDLLLTAIHNHNKTSIEEEYFWTARQRADTFLAKNLKEAAYRELEKPIDKAIRAERFEIAILLQRKQSLIAAYMRDGEKLAKGLDIQQRLSGQLDQKYKLQVLYDRIFHLHRTVGRSREEGHLDEEIRSIMEDPLMREGFEPKSVSATCMLYSIQQIHAYVTKDEVRAIQYSKLLVDTQMANPEIYNPKEGKMLPIVSNYLNSSLSIGILAHYDKYFSWLRNQEFKQEHLKVLQQYQVLKIGLMHACMLNDEDALKLLEEQFVSQQAFLTDEGQVTLIQILSISFYIAGNWGKCIQWCNELFDLTKRFPTRAEFIVETELLLLAVHIEMGNMDLLPNIIRSMENRMLRKGKLRERGKIQLAFTKKYLKCYHDKDAAQILIRETIGELEELRYNVYGVEFDILLWLRSVEQGKRYGELASKANMELINKRRSSFTLPYKN